MNPAPDQRACPEIASEQTTGAAAGSAATNIDPISPEEHVRQSLPRVIGEFEILGLLGEGASSFVYLARQRSLNRLVALKVNKRAGGELTEGALLAGLEHDHIVKVYSAFRDQESGANVLCLQYIPGMDLRSVIEAIHAGGARPHSGRTILDAIDAKSRGETGFDPAALRDREALAAATFPQAVCRIGLKMAEALAFAHEKHVLHCDIKPGNILMTRYGRPMLADFNVSFDRARQPSTVPGGTLPYMSAEHQLAWYRQPGGRFDERSDVYSLGVVLHELSTGKLPMGNPAALDGVPRELAAVINRCLERDAARRYQSARELAQALAATAHLLASRRALPAPGRIGRWVCAHPSLALALAAVVPHVFATVVNIAYNVSRIEFTAAQWRAFLWVMLAYNFVAYPVCVGGACLLCRRIARSMAAGNVDDARRRVLRIGWWAIGLAALGWLPGGLVFPMAIDATAGGVKTASYTHFAISFALSGLIGVVFSYLGVEYVAFRAFFPRIANPDGFSAEKTWEELRPLTAPFGLMLFLACAVPLTGAVILLTIADTEFDVGTRLLVVLLIGAGVAGVGIAERVTRKLRALTAIWQQEKESDVD